MSAVISAPALNGTLADLLDELGSIPPGRVARFPPPGSATEADVLARPDGEKRLFELVDGVLVEKPMGFYESRIAVILIKLLELFLDAHDFGVLVGPDGPLRLAPGRVRLPDISFISWSRLPQRRLPRSPIPDLTPDLAIEILSAGNTEPEMRRKVHEYFQAGTQLIWIIDPENATARMFISPTDVISIDADGELDGGQTLPGFRLSLRELFERAGERE